MKLLSITEILLQLIAIALAVFAVVLVCLSLAGCTANRAHRHAPDYSKLMPPQTTITRHTPLNNAVFIPPLRTPQPVAWAAVMTGAQVGATWEVQTSTDLAHWQTFTSFVAVAGTNLLWQGVATNRMFFIRLKGNDA